MVRLAEQAQYDRLLDEILRNGRPLPLAARLRLSGPGAIAVSAISLALSRMTELTHRPTAGAQLLAGKLLGLQSMDGSFGSPAVTASAIESIVAILEQDRRLISGLDDAFRDRLEEARDRALHALYAEREANSAQSGGLLGDALETALTLWRLGERAVFDGVVGVAGLRRALAEWREHAGHSAGSNEIDSILALSPGQAAAPMAA